MSLHHERLVHAGFHARLHQVPLHAGVAHGAGSGGDEPGPSQQGGGGADGGEPHLGIGSGLADEGHGGLAVLQGVHTTQTAGEHHHVAGGQGYLGQGHVGGDGDTLGALDGGASDTHQGHGHIAPAQHVGGGQGLSGFKTSG